MRHRNDDPIEAECKASFNKFAKQAMVDFPELKGHFALYYTKTQKHTGDSRQHHKGLFPRRKLKKYFKEELMGQELKGGCAETFRRNDGLYIINFTRPMFVMGYQNGDVRFTLSHELGHIVVKNALHRGERFDAHYAECAADIFAVLDHIKQFGADDGFRQQLARERTVGMLFTGETDHFTNLALEALDGMMGEIDFNNLTPQGMADIAAKIAGDMLPARKIYFRTCSIFEKFGDVLEGEKAADIPRRVKIWADALCSDDVSGLDFKVGLAAVKPFYPEARIGDSYWHGSYFFSEEWAKTCEVLKEKESALLAKTPAAKHAASPAPRL